MAPSNDIRRVIIRKGPNGLGFSVKGGGDVGLPLIISRVEAGGSAVGMLTVGMEVNAVNGISLEGLPHYAAVEVLRRTRSPVILFVKKMNQPELVEASPRHRSQNTDTCNRRSMTSRGCSSALQNTDYKLCYGNFDQAVCEADGQDYNRVELDTNRQTLKLTRQATIRRTLCEIASSSTDPVTNRSTVYSDHDYEDPDYVSYSALSENGNGSQPNYDLRSIKAYVKSIIHLPKETFAKKLAWQFPPIALGKFHKWLISKLERFDCDLPNTSASYIYDAFSQSLCLSRSIYDLVHLIRTLMAMERTAPSTALQAQTLYQPPAITDIPTPALMASFLSELSEIRSALAKSKEQDTESRPATPNQDTELRLATQEEEIAALREQLMTYEDRISALKAAIPDKDETNDIGKLFKASFKRIKSKTLKRPSKAMVASYPLDNYVKSKGPTDEIDAVDTNIVNNTSNKSPNNDIRYNSISETGSDAHNEIFIQISGDKVNATTLQSHSVDDITESSTSLRNRVESDDDYVQMQSCVSPSPASSQISDPLSPSVVPPVYSSNRSTPTPSVHEDGGFMRRNSDNRSSVCSSASKTSTESVRSRHCRPIHITNDLNEQREAARAPLSSDYVEQDPLSANSLTSDYVELENRPSQNSDYVEIDGRPILTSDYVEQDAFDDEDDMIDYANLAELTAAKYTSAPVFEGITREKSLEVAEVMLEYKPAEEEKENIPNNKAAETVVLTKPPLVVAHGGSLTRTDVSPYAIELREEKSDTTSTHTMKEEIQVTEELSHNAAGEIGQDVDSILGDVKLLHLMEVALQKPPTLPPNTAYTFDMGNLEKETPAGVYPGGMVRAHTVPIYAKVEKLKSPPAAKSPMKSPGSGRIRPFSFGEVSNCSVTSFDEAQNRHDVCTERAQNRHDVCTERAPLRKTSLTSTGSSIEQKSDYSSDRPSSYNTSRTSTDLSHNTDRFSRVSSEDRRTSSSEDRRLSSEVEACEVLSEVTSPVIPRATSSPVTVQNTSHNQSVKQAMSPLFPYRIPVYEESVYTPPPTNPNADYTYTPTVATPYEEMGLEVGEDFFKKADAKKSGEKPKKGFRKMMSFGKGKQKKKGSIGDADSSSKNSLSRSGSTVSRSDSRTDSFSRNRNSTHSTSSYNVDVTPRTSRDMNPVTPRTSRDMNPVTPRTSRDMNSTHCTSNVSLNSCNRDLSTQLSHGGSEQDVFIQRDAPRSDSRPCVYSGINFDDIPVTNDPLVEEPVLESYTDNTPTSCHKVLEPTSSVKEYTPPDSIKLPEYVRPAQPTSFVPEYTRPAQPTSFVPEAPAIVPVTVEPVQCEMPLVEQSVEQCVDPVILSDNDLSDLDKQILSAPAVPLSAPAVPRVMPSSVMQANEVLDQASFITKPEVAEKPQVAKKPSIAKKPVIGEPVIITAPVVQTPVVRLTPSPSFSEIDEMLGNLSKDLDSFTFGF